MSIRAILANAESSANDGLEPDLYAGADLYSGERICAPREGRRSNPVLRAYVTFAAVVGGSWAVLGHEPTLQEWLSSATAAVSAQMERNAIAAGGGEQAPARLAAVEPKPIVPEPRAVSDVGDAPGSDAGVSAPPPTADPMAAVQPLPPVVVDPSDPYQKRALAVGLHPDLSRVLLSKLTPDDYRNASVAIKTAIAETADDAVFTYPRQSKPDRAQFEVKFVPGVSADCRRYVVTVTKDRWSTTALPMEKCGVPPVRSASTSN
ncbi:MAG: hypothetical protein ACT4OU_05240 [Hyphomicrobium sp.]